MTHTHQTLERLLTIKWDDYDAELDHAGSRARLIVEYFRRSALWAEYLDAGNEWPFFDIAAHIAPHIRANPADLERLHDISRYLYWPPVRTSVEAMLHWATMLDTPGIQLPDLTDPYEPLLIMLERGGAFTTGKGFVDLTLRSVPIKNWRERRNSPALESLDPKSLNEFDKPG